MVVARLVLNIYFIHFVIYLQVKVINGEDMGAMGSLLSIDGEEGVVKMVEGEIKLYALSILAKMHDSD
jgi:hypothetical protein